MKYRLRLLFKRMMGSRVVLLVSLLLVTASILISTLALLHIDHHHNMVRGSATEVEKLRNVVLDHVENEIANKVLPIASDIRKQVQEQVASAKERAGGAQSDTAGSPTKKSGNDRSLVASTSLKGTKSTDTTMSIPEDIAEEVSKWQQNNGDTIAMLQEANADVNSDSRNVIYTNSIYVIGENSTIIGLYIGGDNINKGTQQLTGKDFNLPSQQQMVNNLNAQDGLLVTQGGNLVGVDDPNLLPGKKGKGGKRRRLNGRRRRAEKKASKSRLEQDPEYYEDDNEGNGRGNERNDNQGNGNSDDNPDDQNQQDNGSSSSNQIYTNKIYMIGKDSIVIPLFIAGNNVNEKSQQLAGGDFNLPSQQQMVNDLEAGSGTLVTQGGNLVIDESRGN